MIKVRHRKNESMVAPQLPDEVRPIVVLKDTELAAYIGEIKTNATQFIPHRAAKSATKRHCELYIVDTGLEQIIKPRQILDVRYAENPANTNNIKAAFDLPTIRVIYLIELV